jgi:hypothetical protein
MKTKENLLMLCGAAAGGAVGYLVFFWCARQGFYGLVLPGGLLGFGASLFRSQSRALCAVCGVAGLVLGLVAEWRFAPFIADKSLGYFLAHIPQLRPITLLMIAAGAFLGFWVPYSRRQDQPA